MNAERIHESPTFRVRQGLVDSLSECAAGGESTKELDLERDPFFEAEAWFVPEQSPIVQDELPAEEELARRLHTAAEWLWQRVQDGMLTQANYQKVLAENDLKPYIPPIKAAGGNILAFSQAWPFSVGQLAMGFHIPDDRT